MSVELALPPQLELQGDPFAIAPLSPADLPAVVALEQRSHPYPWTPDNLRTSLASHTCVGIKHCDDWVAHAVLSFVVGEAELLLFVVDKDWQGRGLGTQFLRVLAQAAQQKAQTLFLEVRESNTAAVALYEKLGFNQVGLRPGYYPSIEKPPSTEKRPSIEKHPSTERHSSADGRPSRRGREDALVYALDLTFWDA